MDAGDAENLVSNNETLIFEVNGQRFEFIAEGDNLESDLVSASNSDDEQEYTIIVTQDDDTTKIDERQSIIVNDLNFESTVGENTLEENVFTVQFPIKKEEHPCLVCGRIFSRKADTKRHLKTVHLGEKNFPCKTCGRRFADKRDMNRHANALHVLRPKTFTDQDFLQSTRKPPGPPLLENFETKSDLILEQNTRPNIKEEITETKIEVNGDNEITEKVIIKHEEVQDDFYPFYDFGYVVEI